MSLARFATRFGTVGARLVASSAVRSGAFTTVRAFAAAAGKSKKEATDLASVLTRELDYEKEEGGSDNTLNEVREALTEWKFEDAAGQARFSLAKKFGSQEVRLDLDCSPMPSDEDMPEEDEENEEDEQPADGYRMLVTVKDPSKERVFQAGCFLTDHLRIHRVTLFPKDAAPNADKVFGGFDELSAYAGPNFDELDNAVQTAFYEFLAERGVDDTLAEQLADYCAAKEQTEYVGWLAAARDFAKK